MNNDKQMGIIAGMHFAMSHPVLTMMNDDVFGIKDGRSLALRQER